MKLAALLAALLFATPAHAWRLGLGAEGGILDDQPATALMLELDSPNSHLHLRPRFQVWKPEDELGRWELSLEAYYHTAPCQSPSFYVGGGLGAEWLAVAAPPAPCACSAPPPDSPPVDPPSPIASLIAGVRFPCKQADLFFEGRITWHEDGDETFGPFIGIGFHEPRHVH